MNPILSIDVSKSNSYAAAFLSNSKPYTKPFKFKHSPDELSGLLSILSELENITGTCPNIDLVDCLKVRSRTRSWSEEKAKLIVEATKESLPDNTSQQSNIYTIDKYVKLITHIKNLLADVRDQMVKQAKLSPYYELLLSIPGIGEMTASTILSEIGDVSRFPTAKQLVAYTGIDPSVYQSGTFKASNNKISKRGSTYLRKALYQATCAGISKRSSGYANPLLRAYYDKKISEGKPSKIAIVATSNKLLRIIYGILKGDKPFTLNH